MVMLVILEYDGKRYAYEHDFPEAEAWDAEDGGVEEMVVHLYTDGNYDCDCNRSAFIGQECDENFPEMRCGRDIKLIALSPLRSS